MRLVGIRRGTALLCVSALALAVWACETARHIGGIQADTQKPSITLGNAAGDTQDIAGGLRFTVSAVDNLALKSVDLTFSGGLIGTLDTTFVGQVKTYAVGRQLTFSSSSGAGGNITIIGRATDGAGNFDEDTISIFLSNVQALQVVLISPARGAVASQNRSIPIEIRATQNSGIAKVGFLVAPRSAVSNPTVPPNDSIVFLGALKDTVDYTDTLTVLAATGTFDVIGFAEDSAGRRGYTNIVTVTIQSAANDVTPPLVSHSIGARVEVDDTVIVRATDASAIGWIGFRVDTVIVVNGVTVPLAGASSIADAIYNANLRELYLTNPAFNRVDVFQVANTAFVAGGIPTAGGQPWGVALWPHDTLGNYGDTIVVADAGGTYLGIINVGAGGPRQIIWRQDLPDYIIQTYKVLPQANGAVVHITDYHTSDLPQYVATVCRAASGGSTCHADSVYALYSTAPTGAETPPFNGRATLRMEKLINTTNPALKFGHLFWEIATSSYTQGSDTLRIVLTRGRNFTKVILAAWGGVTVQLSSMGLGDRTFARNSGNFTHAFFGEGGNVTASFARVMAYDARDQLVEGAFATCSTGNGTTDGGQVDIDFGMSPGRDVSDFIANTGVKVVSVATNFNGLTNAVRADSIYYLDQDLRRKVTSAAPPGPSPLTPGMDMNYFHDFAPTGTCPPLSTSCGNGTDKNQRLMFSASPSGNIDVFDTYFGAFLGSIPVRDPIIGPLRVARDAGGNQLLFGVTPTGLLVLSLPAFTNPLPVPPQH